ncbi:MAG TPA: RdgB/HAM1 family non-canonical purine NTP pyrophosphatase [Candidatus Acidoferrum sp.]
MRAHARLFLASSNPGKLSEYRALAHAAELGLPGKETIALELLPGFEALPPFEETAPTFAENAAGKALHYSRFCDGPVFADDSGLVVPALGGAPGVLSARYAGPGASSAERNAKLLGELRGKSGRERAAYFVCAIALAERGRAKAIVTARVDGKILEAPRGDRGFGYDPVFYVPALRKGFAEISAEEKNEHSHRGRAFRKLLAYLLYDRATGQL